MGLLDRATTQSWDRPLFAELELEPFDIPCREKHFCGRVKIGDSIVDIWVEAMPALFWEFEIKGDKSYHVTTGSGSLKDY